VAELVSVMAAMKALGMVVHVTGRANVVGLRRIPGNPNTFDDLMCCFYKLPGHWVFYAWPCTTDPGTYWLQNPTRVAGTAIVKPGQYLNSHRIGFHHIGKSNQYEAMQQVGTLRVWRDANKDTVLDYGRNEMTATGSGINIHKAGTDSANVDKWSAGCQVFKKSADFDVFMSIMRERRASGFGDLIDYTLLECPENQF
jgi:hypothetical protein